MHGRFVTPQILTALADTPAVFLQGPRQAGKSTLVQSLRGHGFDATYLTLDDAAVLDSATRDGDGFVDGLPERVILDEVQRAPDIFRSLKRSIDRRRAPGRFLLTGSANALLLPKVSESLAGRVEILKLYPFSQGEVAGVQEGFVDACFASSFLTGRFPDSGWPSLVDRIVRGGFPDAVARTDLARRREWFRSYSTSLIERDVRDIANIQALRELPRLFQLLAARSACVLNVSDLARDAELPLTTLQRHLALLNAIFFATTIPAWSGNLSSRATKAPKTLLFDPGLLCSLLNLDADRLRSDPLMSGAVLETFVATELIKQSTWSEARPSLFHFRTIKQHEVDLVLEDARGRVVGIEVKKTASPRSDDFRGLRELAAAAGKRFLRGIVLYTGDVAVGFGKDLYAIPVSARGEPRAA
ncbi:MAG: ATPase [Planctomycetota bacterium]|nr:MAG: ATPase [Planctomycetota bacterium]